MVLLRQGRIGCLTEEILEFDDILHMNSKFVYILGTSTKFPKATLSFITNVRSRGSTQLSF
jgi:hypothetical protein